ncbi:MAG: MoxR family ATPase [Pyrinomonadaceae bacterium]|nr:MoxR family ATPase [Pyrinomonadaceae bacterium]
MRDFISTKNKTASESASLHDHAPDKIARLQETIGRVIKGKSEIVKLSLVTLIARGHLLIEDVPGIGKTTLANAFARALDLSFQRVQFTSDLLPSDVIGLSIFNQQSGTFEWNPGPIFTNILLADEINRSTPKTQSALLEAMAEEQVTVEGASRPLPLPFMVVATQNPTEHHGTYPLPESQLDRFTLRLHVGYPNKSDERSILRDREKENPLEFVEPVMSENDVLELQQLAKMVKINDSLMDYLLSIVEQTRQAETIELGISPRGTLSLFQTAQALALVDGRDFCTPDDIKSLIVPCFAHRLIISSQYKGAASQTNEAEQILKDILTKVEVPI